MQSNKQIPLNDIGGTGVFPLMAEQFSSPPAAPEGGAARDEAPAAAKATPVMRLLTEAEARDSFLVSRPLYTRYAPGLTSETGRAITRSGMWSGVGFVGASIVAAGLLMLVNGGATAGIALAAVLAGSAVAAFGWRRAWKVLDDIDRAGAAVATAPPPRACGPGQDHSVALQIAPAHPRTALAVR